MTYNRKQCCRVIFGNRSHVTDLATMCVSTSHQPPLEEIFASQVYGLTVYLKTTMNDRFGKNQSKSLLFRSIQMDVLTEFDSNIISSNVASRRGLLYAVSDPITAVNSIVSASGHYMAPGKWAGVSISFTRVCLDCDGCFSENLSLQPLFSYFLRRTTQNCRRVYCLPIRACRRDRPIICTWCPATTFIANAIVSLPVLGWFSNANSTAPYSTFIRQVNVILEYSSFSKQKPSSHSGAQRHSLSLSRLGNVTPCEPDVMIDAYSAKLAQKIKQQSTSKFTSRGYWCRLLTIPRVVISRMPGGLHRQRLSPLFDAIATDFGR